MISSVSYYRTVSGYFLSLRLLTNHTADIERKLNMLGKFLNSCAVATDPESTAGSYRLLYPTTPPPHHSSKMDVQHTLTHSYTETKAIRQSHDRSHKTHMRSEHNKQISNGRRQGLRLTIIVSTWMNSWRETSCVSLKSLRMLKRSISLRDTIMRISALSSVPRPCREDQ